MEWSVTNLVIQLVMGVLAGHAAAAVAKEHSFGWLGHTLTGAVGGGLSGLFLQTLASTIVTASGSLAQPRPAELLMVQALTGAGAGAIVTLLVGFLKHGISTHK
ncbi:MAG: hypothetical protein JOZ17_05855 [Acetobacteraceae bacterium]|nr:hypothetical protein [Acetobacteraceae bacterium]